MTTPDKKIRKKSKTRYRLKNWSAYNEGLKKRGKITLWFDNEVVEKWYYQGPKKKGGNPLYSETAIEVSLMIKQVFSLGYRQTEGFMESLAELMDLSIAIPDYTTLCRRNGQLDIRLNAQVNRGEPIHLVVDSSGLKVYGEGEWKVRQHGQSKRRSWRKFHVGVDENSGQIVALELTTNSEDDAGQVGALLEEVEDQGLMIKAFGGDGAYDKRKVYEELKKGERKIESVIPPRKDAKIWQHGNSKNPPLKRDENLRAIRRHGRKKWKRQSGYHRRSISETTIYRYKKTFGSALKSRKMDNQINEARIGARILNKMLQVAKPESIAA